MTAAKRPAAAECPGLTETDVRDLAKTLSGSSEIRRGQVMGEARREDKPNVALSDIGRAEV